MKSLTPESDLIRKDLLLESDVQGQKALDEQTERFAQEIQKSLQTNQPIHNFEKHQEEIVSKTTIIKSAEPLKLKSNVFAKGFKVEITWNLDVNNPIQLDQIMLERERSPLKQAVEAFIKYNEDVLGYKHLKDNEVA